MGLECYLLLHRSVFKPTLSIIAVSCITNYQFPGRNSIGINIQFSGNLHFKSWVLWTCTRIVPVSNLLNGIVLKVTPILLLMAVVWCTPVVWLGKVQSLCCDSCPQQSSTYYIEIHDCALVYTSKHLTNRKLSTVNISWQWQKVVHLYLIMHHFLDSFSNAWWVEPECTANSWHI